MEAVLEVLLDVEASLKLLGRQCVRQYHPLQCSLASSSSFQSVLKRTKIRRKPLKMTQIVSVESRVRREKEILT